MTLETFSPFFLLSLKLRREIYLLATLPRIVHVQEGYGNDYEEVREKFLLEPNQLSLDPSIAYCAFNWRDHIPSRARQRTLEDFGFAGANRPHQRPWNSMVFLGKFGSFRANEIIGRPYHLMFEILDTPDKDGHGLRIMSAAELHTEELISEATIPEQEDGGGSRTPRESESNEGTPMSINREIIDDGSAQRMTLDEIEALKRGASGAGREIIAQLLKSHSAIELKTEFSLAKYALRKRRKYIKRFTVLPLDVSVLTQYMMEEKDAFRTMELRDEILELVGCCANVHHRGGDILPTGGDRPSPPSGRYLVVDDACPGSRLKTDREEGPPPANLSANGVNGAVLLKRSEVFLPWAETGAALQQEMGSAYQ